MNRQAIIFALSLIDEHDVLSFLGLQRLTYVVLSVRNATYDCSNKFKGKTRLTERGGVLMHLVCVVSDEILDMQ